MINLRFKNRKKKQEMRWDSKKLPSLVDKLEEVLSIWQCVKTQGTPVVHIKI